MRSTMLVMLGGLALAVLSACASDEMTGPPYSVYVVLPDGHGGQRVGISSLEVRDLRTLACDAFSFETGSAIRAEYGENAGTVTDGSPVDLQVSRDGDAYAARDLDGLIMLTSAHHLLAAKRSFDELGLATFEPAFPPHRVVFFPRSVSAAGLYGPGPTTDNAFFTDSIRGFAILRANALDSLPLSVNRGVLAHELAHAVWAHVGRGKPFLILLTSLNEGLADVHGAAQTGDPAFVGVSAPQERENRDLSMRRVYDEAAERAARDTRGPYVHGSVVASTFWDFHARLVALHGMSEPDARLRMARLAFDALRDVESPTPASPANSLQALENLFWRAAVSSSRAAGDEDAFCAALRDHFPDTQLDTPTKELCK
jgi:hypothetical protein